MITQDDRDFEAWTRWIDSQIDRVPWSVAVGLWLGLIKEGAALLDIDPAQLSRWISGAESVQVHRILDCRRLHGPFVIAFAADADGVAVDTVITVRRTV